MSEARNDDMAEPYGKPLPILEGLHGEFYNFCKQHELRFQRCTNCNTWRHTPREICADCASWDWEWAQSSGKGRVFTWTTVERALHPDFVDSVPRAPAIIELEEGVRILSNVVDCSPYELEIDMAVEVCFDDVTDEVTLPRFRRVSA
jgi:uncharacterized OB-fold protein